jgi:cell division protein FtsW
MELTAGNYDSIAAQIAMVVLLLMAVGAVFVFSASANVTQDIDLSRFYEYTSLRQSLFFVAAVVVMWIVSYIDYRRLSMSKGLWKSPATYLLIASVTLLAAVLIPRIGTEINYARRWLRIPIGSAQMSFQPSELAKWALIIFLAATAQRYNDRLR